MFCKFHMLGFFLLCWISAERWLAHAVVLCVFQCGDAHSSCVDPAAVKFCQKLNWWDESASHRDSALLKLKKRKKWRLWHTADDFLAEVSSHHRCSCTFFFTFFLFPLDVQRFFCGSLWHQCLRITWFLAPHLTLFLFPVLVSELKTSCSLDLLLL